jgi:cell division protein ZapA
MKTSSGKEAISRVRVDIFGETCTVRGDGADPEYIAGLARMVDERMRDLAGQAPSLPRTRLALLVALNMADELTQARSATLSEDVPDQSLIVQKTRYLIGLLDEGMVGDGF